MGSRIAPGASAQPPALLAVHDALEPCLQVIGSIGRATRDVKISSPDPCECLSILDVILASRTFFRGSH